MSDISQTIQAKSDQLNACDLIAGGVKFTVISTIVNVKTDPPVSIKLSGDTQPYKPCLSMRRVLAKLWGTESKQWEGRTIELFCDPSTMWAGEKVGGIRISALSDIDKNTDVTVRASKHKVTKYLIQKIEIKKLSLQEVLEMISNSKNIVELKDKSILDAIASTEGENIKKAQGAWTAKKDALKAEFEGK